MKIVAISDTHTMHREVKVPDGDVLVHAGDLTFTGKILEWREALNWIRELPHKHKIIIAGNHDFGRHQVLPLFNGKDFHYLEDSGVMIDGVTFWGSPYTPTFLQWAYMADRGAVIKKHWDLIPPYTDVLITHGPPWGILDTTGEPNNPGHLGCEDLYDAVIERVLPKVHIFGHIHGGYGHKSPHSQFYNASVINEEYQVVNKPWEIEL